MAHDLLGLLLTEHLLSRSQEATECNLAELLLFQVLGNIHAHPELFVALAYVANERGASACAQMEPRCLGEACASTQLSLDFKVQRLLVDLGLHLL